MHAEDHSEFAELLSLLGETFNESVSASRAAAYWDALEDIPIDTVRAAVRRTIRGARFFPKPVELREAVGEIPPDPGLIESLIVAHLRRTGGERTPIAEPFLALVVERLGGLRTVAMMDARERRRLLERIVPPCVIAARVREIPFPSLIPTMPRLRLLKGEGS